MFTQLGMEYGPQPTFLSGSPRAASPALVTRDMLTPDLGTRSFGCSITPFVNRMTPCTSANNPPRAEKR